MTSILCIVNTGAGPRPSVKKIDDPMKINYQWLVKQFPNAQTIKATWYTGTAHKNELYCEEPIKN
jgi:hypothetical protein